MCSGDPGAMMLSLVGTPEANQLLWRIAAWLGLAAIVTVTLSISLPPGVPESTRDLAGSWDVRVEQPAGVAATELELPGLFAHGGIVADARVQARREIALDGAGPHALWIDTPQYAVEVSWDGAPLRARGDPSAPRGPGTRSTASLLVPLPPHEPGTSHELTLDLRGDFGKGGLTGRVLVGPLVEVYGAARTAETQRLAMALGLSLLGILPLAVATRRPRRDAFVCFGLFSTCAAAMIYGHSDLVYSMIPEAEWNIRVRRMFAGPIAPFAVCFAASFIFERRRRPEIAFIWVGLAISASGLLVPADALYLTELLNDSLYVVALPWFTITLVQGIRHRRPGAVAILVAFVPIVFGVVSEIMLSHGLRGGGSHLLTSSLLFIVGCGAALVLREARESERHDQLVTGSMDAMVRLDKEGVILDMNPAAMRLFGEDTPGGSFLQWVVEDDRPIVRAHLERSRKSRDRSEFRLDTGRFEGVVESLATALDGGVAMLAVLRDVTERRKIEEGLLQSARMDTVAILLGGIAHDFNNMLGTLLAHVGFLQVTLEDDDALQRLDRMEGTIGRASQLTKRLLTVARGTGAELGPVALEEVCRGASELVGPTLAGDVTLRVDLPDELPPVHGDATDLEQVLVNLLINASDALNGSGTISLVARPFRIPGRGRGVGLMVEDDGPGVPDDMRAKIFQPFVTTKARGTGLGLAVASQILNDHHGRIWHEPRPGGGTRFLVALRHADIVDEAPAPMPEGRRVLLVEDERVLLDDYAGALRRGGYEVFAFSDSAAASMWLRDHQPDILVTDVVMPGIGGVELANQCKSLYPDVPVLLVSAFIPQQSLDGLSTMDGLPQLHKPLRAARLVSSVGRLRRRAERAQQGKLDITSVSYLFPPLDTLTAAALGLG